MKRLTESISYPLNTFQRCQLCGYANSDICEFRMFMECDDNDKIEPAKIIIRCNKRPCVEAIDKHPRLYVEVPWGQGDPGIFMLLCGNCPNRKDTRCTHPDLKANGGAGLEVKTSDLPKITVCFNDYRGCRDLFPNPIVSCKGHP